VQEELTHKKHRYGSELDDICKRISRMERKAVEAERESTKYFQTLFVVDKSTDEQIIQSRSVTVEYIEEERAFVSGAISQGELVVVSGLHRLTPNQTVQNVQMTTTKSS
jgi:exoribonuclease R